MCALLLYSGNRAELCLAEILESSTSETRQRGSAARNVHCAREGEGGKRAGGGGEERGGATSRKRRGGEALDIEAPAIQNPAPSRNVVSK